MVLWRKILKLEPRLSTIVTMSCKWWDEKKQKYRRNNGGGSPNLPDSNKVGSLLSRIPVQRAPDNTKLKWSQPSLGILNTIATLFSRQARRHGVHY